MKMKLQYYAQVLLLCSVTSDVSSPNSGFEKFHWLEFCRCRKDLTLLSNIRYLTLFQRLSDIYKIPAIEYVTGFEIKF